ncbi:MAG TPA: GGDEF domain-containing protein [Acidimicrobiales bacterium]|nr:GGDEF domain-containing protein [Acidimicrobiales bacterium]
MEEATATGGAVEEGNIAVEHWTQVLANVSLWEFVLLAALTTLQWIRHRIRGAGWVALSFAILGGISLVVKYDASLFLHLTPVKVLLALLLVMPYCLFRFAASFRQPSLAVRAVAVAVTVGIVVFTFTLSYLPLPGFPPPPHWLAYRVSFLAEFTFLFAYVVVRLFMAGSGEPPIAAYRMRLLAVAVAGLQVQVLVAALQLHGTTTALVTEAITVAMGVLFLVALVLPSFVRVALSRREDLAFRRAVGELVSAGDSKEVGDRLLPHVCALVGASRAALLTSDGTVVARYPVGAHSDGIDEWGRADGGGGDREQRRITVRAHSGPSHELAVRISPYLPYFGSEELGKLDQLASMVGLAIERCEMADQVAFQASHDSLTGLANRTLFMERLAEALGHVGRRSNSLALIFIDLDRFKLVNDHADHSAGDLVLQEMANRMMAITRGVDIVARFGGDEFVAFAEVDHEEDALEMAERIRRGLSAPIQLGGAQLVVTASIGVVVTSDGTSPPALLLRDADNAMYDAKRAGRDQVIMYRTNARDLANRKWGIEPATGTRLNAG